MRTSSLSSSLNSAAVLLTMCIPIVTGNCKTPPEGGSPASSEVVIHTLEIKPSHDGVSYDGKFSLLNQGESPLKLHCANGPINQRFLPNNIMFQVLENGVWKKVPSTGLGDIRLCDIPPGIPVELYVNLRPFEEQDEPFKARVIFNWDQFPSDPFTLDWKSDRKAGKFLAAKKAHAERLRSAFIRSGFRPELLNGDDFPTRLINGMIASLAKSGEAGKWFGIYDRKGVEIDATMTWKGDVSIIFSSKGGGGTVGILQWNPENLNRALIENLRKTDGFAEVTVDEKSGKHSGLVIVINPDDPMEPDALEYVVRPFEMRLSVSLAESEAESLPMPKKGEPEKALDSVMDYLKGCLTR